MTRLRVYELVPLVFVEFFVLLMERSEGWVVHDSLEELHHDM